MPLHSTDPDRAAIYGARARIGYTCPPLLAEVFPYVIAHGYGREEDARLAGDAEHYGCKVLGVMGWGATLDRFGSIPASAALELGRELMRRHPNADGIFFPSPHWPVIQSIDPLERESTCR